MRIISKFHDYYDTVMSFGQDDDLCWRREQKTIPHEVNIFRTIYSRPYGKYILTFHPKTIGFCGNFYNFLDVYVLKFGWIISESEICYSLEDFMKFVSQFDGLAEDKDILKFKGPFFGSKPIKNFFSKERTEYKDLFVKHHVPYFLIEENEILLNPRLADTKFFKVFDPYTAFQEISMYISGVLGQQEKETVNISDKEMLTKKGFDAWSFKRKKHKKKRKKS